MPTVIGSVRASAPAPARSEHPHDLLGRVGRGGDVVGREDRQAGEDTEPFADLVVDRERPPEQDGARASEAAPDRRPRRDAASLATSPLGPCTGRTARAAGRRGPGGRGWRPRSVRPPSVDQPASSMHRASHRRPSPREAMEKEGREREGGGGAAAAADDAAEGGSRRVLQARRGQRPWPAVMPPPRQALPKPRPARRPRPAPAATATPAANAADAATATEITARQLLPLVIPGHRGRRGVGGPAVRRRAISRRSSRTSSGRRSRTPSA